MAVHDHNLWGLAVFVSRGSSVSFPGANRPFRKNYRVFQQNRPARLIRAVNFRGWWFERGPLQPVFTACGRSFAELVAKTTAPAISEGVLARPVEAAFYCHP